MQTLAYLLFSLAAAHNSDEPANRREARALFKSSVPVITALREWHDELDGFLSDAEDALQSLDEAADADGRADAHGKLVAAAGTLHYEFAALAAKEQIT